MNLHNSEDAFLANDERLIFIFEARFEGFPRIFSAEDFAKNFFEFPFNLNLITFIS